MLSCDGFLTYSQGAYGGPGAPFDYMAAHFATVFPSGVQIGNQTAGAATDLNVGAGQRAALFTSAAAVQALLPVGGVDTPPQGLQGDSINATSLDAGALAGHTLAIVLSLGFDAANPLFDGNASNGLLSDLVYQASSGITTVLNGMTVGQIVAEANQYLSGAATAHTGAVLTLGLNLIIQEYDGGVQNTSNVLELECGDCDDPIETTRDVFIGGVISGQKWEDHNGDGIQDLGDDGIKDWNITLIRDVDGDGFGGADDVIVATSTAADGTYSFTALAAGNYRVQEGDVPGWTHTTVAFHDVTLTATIEVAVEEINNDGDDCVDEVRTTTTTTVSSSSDNSFGNFENIKIRGLKYQDHNGNGVQDDGDQPLAGWTFILNDNGNRMVDVGETTAVTNAAGVFCFTDVGPGVWTVVEAIAGANWIQTQGNSGYDGTAYSGENAAGLVFGNTLVAGQNGKTIGFWSNKNGQALITPADIAALNALNLKNAVGVDAVFTNAASVKNFLLGATATNMANMLSAQLAAMQLNVLHGFYGASTSIYIGGALASWSGNTQGASLAANLDHDGDADNADADGLVNAFGFAKISDLIAAANAELALHSTAFSGAAWRAYQESLKIAFDGMNNNLPIFAV
ncbi:MAG: hypothetical protein KDA61_03825 [Planctomycetales bacterium]|nr:hypothetical protein [Planctomycetales bacterium]